MPFSGVRNEDIEMADDEDSHLSTSQTPSAIDESEGQEVDETRERTRTRDLGTAPSRKKEGFRT
jgi:hypothetical protein